MCDCLERAITKGRGSQHLLCCKMRKSIRHYGWLGVLTQVLSLSFSLSNTHTHTHIQTHTHSFLSISGNSFALRRAVKRAPRKKKVLYVQSIPEPMRKQRGSACLIQTRARTVRELSWLSIALATCLLKDTP